MKYALICLLTALMVMAPSGCDIENAFDEFLPDNENAPTNESFGVAGTIGSNEQVDDNIEYDQKIEIGEVEGGIGIVDDDEKEVEQPEIVFAVTDKIDYKKPIKGYTYKDGKLVVDTENAGAYGNHVIRVPQIAGVVTDEIERINEKLYANAENEYNTLLKDGEGVNTYNIDYYADANEKAIAIIQQINHGEQMIGGYMFYKTLYFDCEKQVEISFDEYLSIMGYNRDTLTAKLKTLEDKYNDLTDENLKNVTGVILGEETIYVLVDFPNAIDPAPSCGLFTFKNS